MNVESLREAIKISKLIRTKSVEIHSLLQAEFKNTDEGFAEKYAEKKAKIEELCRLLP